MVIAEAISLETAMEFIRDNFSPDDIFDSITLGYWAEDNDYIHASKIHEH
jgi:hypothetical protein